MAKNKVTATNYASGDSFLVTGAQEMYQSRGQTFGSKTREASGGMGISPGMAKAAATEAKVSSYMAGLPGGLDFDKVPPVNRDYITATMADRRMEYAAAAKIASKFPAGSSAHTEAIAKMADVNQYMRTLSADLDKFKERKKELPDFNNGLTSAGNDPDKTELLTDALTDTMEMEIGPNGNVYFKGTNGVSTSLNDLPEYFNKDYTTYGTFETQNNAIYEESKRTGKPMDAFKRRDAERTLRNNLKKGGRESLLSMATDDFLNIGGPIVPDAHLYDNKELEERIVQSYMTGLDESSAEGASRYEKKGVKAKDNPGTEATTNWEEEGYPSKNTAKTSAGKNTIISMRTTDLAVGSTTESIAYYDGAADTYTFRKEEDGSITAVGTNNPTKYKFPKGTDLSTMTPSAAKEYIFVASEVK